jgi:hypothetical protein
LNAFIFSSVYCSSIQYVWNHPNNEFIFYSLIGVYMSKHFVLLVDRAYYGKQKWTCNKKHGYKRMGKRCFVTFQISARFTLYTVLYRIQNQKKNKIICAISVPLKIFDRSKLQRWIALFWNQRKMFLIPISTYLKKTFC